MSGSKILWLQVFTVFGIVIGAIWGATEWTAWQLAFQPELGSPWWRSAGFPMYLPPAFFWWWFAYGAYAPEVFLHGAYIVSAGTFVAIIAAIGMSVWRAREAQNVITYGSARWAQPDEVRAAGLLVPDGVLLGKLGRDYLRHDGPEHVLCFAPTRSGKGVGLVVPTLLSWSGSAIVHDIKGENWTLTAGFRSRFGRALLFDPTNPDSSAYNPLLEVRRGEWEVRDVQNVADVLVDPEGSLEKRNHWEKTSHFRWTPKLGQELGGVKIESRRLMMPGYAASSLVSDGITSPSSMESFSVCDCGACGYVCNALALCTYPRAVLAAKISRGVR